MKALFAAVFAAALFLSGPSWAQDTGDKVLDTPFTALVSFGDSYTDNGFADGRGFKRYCEAWTWTEYLAQMTGLTHDNRAWGGAMSDERNCNHPEGVVWSGLNWQVDDYLKALTKDEDISTVLFTVMAGSNDAWMGIDDGAVTAANIRTALEKLAAAGARHILYRETSAVLMSPGYLDGPYASYSEPWAKLVNESNAATRKGLLEDFAKKFPEVTLYYQQTDGLFGKIKNGEEGFKFEISDKPWWGTYTWPEPHKYVWYDDWHPMSQVHKMMAEESLEDLRAKLK